MVSIHVNAPTVDIVRQRRLLGERSLNPMINSLRLLRLALTGAVLTSTALFAATYRVTVASTDVDRAAQRVSFPLPEGAPRDGTLRASDGKALPLQVAGDGTATFIVPVQQAGQALSFTLGAAPAPAFVAGVDVRRTPERLHVTVGGAPVFDYQMDKEALPRPDIAPHYKRAGYLHPVYTPEGRLVTEDFRPGREHHHGIWASWTHTKFQGRSPDFWNTHQGTGTVEFVGLDWTWNGPVHGGFVARHQFVDPPALSPVVVLNETWEVTVYNVAGARVFDILITQVCATNDPLVLPEFRYGGMGLRGSGEWTGQALPKILTSEGETDRVRAHTHAMRWIHIGGPVGGAPAGIAMMGHPDNFRAPQQMRVGEGEPFFCFTPSLGGDWAIEPGKPYVARYRFVAADGEPDQARLDAYWNGFAVKPVVAVEKQTVE